MSRSDTDALLDFINHQQKAHKKEVTALKSKVTKLQNQLVKLEMASNVKPI